jgi:hypothetical protein
VNVKQGPSSQGILPAHVSHPFVHLSGTWGKNRGDSAGLAQREEGLEIILVPRRISSWILRHVRRNYAFLALDIPKFTG